MWPEASHASSKSSQGVAQKQYLPQKITFFSQVYFNKNNNEIIKIIIKTLGFLLAPKHIKISQHRRVYEVLGAWERKKVVLAIPLLAKPPYCGAVASGRRDARSDMAVHPTYNSCGCFQS